MFSTQVMRIIFSYRKYNKFNNATEQFSKLVFVNEDKYLFTIL